MPSYVHVDLDILQRVADPDCRMGPTALKVYAAIARKYERLSAQPALDAIALCGLPNATYEQALHVLRYEGLVRDGDCCPEPLRADGDDYLSRSSDGRRRVKRKRQQAFIQLADNLFRQRDNQSKPSIFTVMTPEQFYLFCLLLQGVRLSLWSGVTPEYVHWDDDRRVIHPNIKTMLRLAGVKEKPADLLDSLLEGETAVFAKVAVPMQRRDSDSSVFTIVSAWDSRNSDNRLHREESPSKHAPTNSLVNVLFYSVVDGEVVFGSEMKAVLADPRVPTTLDEQALDETAVFGYISSPERTPFACIKQVPPGSVVEVCGGRVLVHKYWEPEPARHGGAESCADSAEAVLECLRGGLEQMLDHDPLDKGFYLSGGVDSSLLVMLAAQLQAGPPSTFTLADCDDTPDLLAARAVAKVVGADHHEFRVTLDDYLQELPTFVQHYENVVAGGVFDIHGGMAYQMLSRKISEHVRVAFSGEGADELFGGYYWSYTHPLGFSDRIRGRLDTIGSPDAVAEQVNALFPRPEDEAVYQRNLFDFLIRGGLSNYHLWSVDRSCSAFGFEVRPAYLHDDLVELALSLPIEAKVLGSETKRVLKEAARPVFERYGVSHLLGRKKSGMPAAVDRIALQVEDVARGLVSDADLASHPFRRWVKSPLDAVMFDLFHHVFVENRGALSTGFDVEAFYRSGDRARMYR